VTPFSRDYTPQIDAAAIKRQAKASKTATERRAAGMASDDPIKRAAATGNMGELSSATNHKLAKNSRIG
jgi:hypothetical protein